MKVPAPDTNVSGSPRRCLAPGKGWGKAAMASPVWSATISVSVSSRGTITTRSASGIRSGTQ